MKNGRAVIRPLNIKKKIYKQNSDNISSSSSIVNIIATLIQNQKTNDSKVLLNRSVFHRVFDLHFSHCSHVFSIYLR